MVEQGYEQGACLVGGRARRLPACQLTLRNREGRTERLITSMHLSRPENYLSIYQSGCNLSCRKCHSYEFSQYCKGEWRSAKDILRLCREYEEHVNLVEPREKATTFHASDTCRSCGLCVLTGRRSSLCPGVIGPEKILLSPQGWGPVRNIVAFTGGDVMCRPEFYVECAVRIKEETSLWILLETNGYGLTPENLDIYRDAGVDAFWLDIKAYREDVHRWLTGSTNRWILELPREITERGFSLEVLSLYIPDVVEADQLGEIARVIARVNPAIPFTLLAFFPQYRMNDRRSPTLDEMIGAYKAARGEGLKSVRLGNLGVFARGADDYKRLLDVVGLEGL
jgi:pyruvate-formate lyase-activating enzyme